MTVDELRTRPLLFGKMIMPEMFTYPSPDFHYEMARTYVNRVENPKTCFIAPRGHAKSSVVAGIFPLHHLLCEDPGQRKLILLISRVGDHPRRLLQTIKDTLNYSKPLRAMFGYWGQYSARVWRDDYVILKDGSVVMAKGTGQQIIGMKIGHQRPTMIIVDDPEDTENTRTLESMEKNFEWLLRSVVPTRDPSRARVIVIGTPQHSNCMVESLARSQADWTVKRWSALNEDDTKALWPDGPWPLERLLKEKQAASDLGRLSYFMREYQCVVTSDEENRLDSPRYYDGKLIDHWGGQFLELVSGTEKTVTPVNVFMGIDPATSVSARADFTAIVPVAVDRNRNFYVLPYVRRRMRPSDTIAEIIRLNDALSPKGVALESTAAQETFRDILRNHQGKRIPGIARKILPRERKEKRYLDVLEPLLRIGKIHVLRTMHDMVAEIQSYGPLSQHDDLLDGLYYAVHYAYPPSHEFQPEHQMRQQHRSRRVEESWMTS